MLNNFLVNFQSSITLRNVLFVLTVSAVLNFLCFFAVNRKLESYRYDVENSVRNIMDEKFAIFQSNFILLRLQIESIKKRTKRSAFKDYDSIKQKTDLKDSNVEFFNPKLKPELEKKIQTPNGENWVWLTSYSRIPLTAIQGFCSATKEYCPPGEKGSPGPPGFSGLKGEQGAPGQPGTIGPAGPKGPRGPQGDIGWPGSPGLDGRDGLPGEPGIDGAPGRNGLDGIPGIDGSPGRNGERGLDGFNGTDGMPGVIGPIGPEGPPGPKGLTGPRGKPGKPGMNGVPGTPGITAYQVKVNGSTSSELLIPPSIVGSAMTLYKPIIVDEGDNLRLRCVASGHPKPIIEWRKQESNIIPLGAWKTLSVQDTTLNITQINRVHMGTYECIADNGIPPKKNQTFNVEVHFAPMIKIYKQMFGVVINKFVVLECDIEAFPYPVVFWERGDGLLIENDTKYTTETIDKHNYGLKMILNITKVEKDDFTVYHCICKNAKGLTKASFTIYEIDSRLSMPQSSKFETYSNIFIYGLQPPELVSMEDLCPPQITCPDCPNAKDLKCENGISLFDLVGKLEIRPFNNISFIGLPNRTSECMLYAVGKAVYHRYTNETYGTWMKDLFYSEKDFSKSSYSDKYWTTSENDSNTLFEYSNKSTFFRNTPLKRYNLEHAFRGNSHIVYNGSFYYQDKNNPRILKYDLGNGHYRSLHTPLLETKRFLYSTEYNQIDFNADDNGLWVIYGLQNSNNTIVMKVYTDNLQTNSALKNNIRYVISEIEPQLCKKIEANSMQTEFMWNISINNHKIGEMFVVCGVLYGVDSVKEGKTKIRLALDLYTYKLLDFSPLEFTNPFHKTTMITYNHHNKELMTWDRGNQLTYPVRYNEIDKHFNVSHEEQTDQNINELYNFKTGYEVGVN